MTCATCHRPVEAPSQTALSGIDAPVYCPGCERKRQITHFLAMLPECDEQGFDQMTKFEQDFLESVREQFDERGTLSDRQLDVLQRIYQQRQ